MSPINKSQTCSKKQPIGIPEVWNRFENWLAKNAPHLSKTLNSAASSSNIEQLEKIIGIKLPTDY